LFGHDARFLSPYIKVLGAEINLEPAAAAIDLALPVWYQSISARLGPAADGRTPRDNGRNALHRRLNCDVVDLRASRYPLTDMRLAPGYGRTGRPASHNFIERQEEI